MSKSRNTTPSISVIIPTYNVEEYIEECLESVYASTGVSREVIVVDNGSSDNTISLLQKLREKYGFTLTSEKKRGASAARNKGLALANAEWTQFLDADDLLMPDKLDRQYALADGKCLVAASYIRRSVNGSEERIEVGSGDPWFDLFVTKLGITSANLWNTDVLNSINGFDETLSSSQEYELMFRYLLSGAQVKYDDVPLTIVRERPSSSVSRTDPAGKWQRYVELRIRIVGHLKSEKNDLYLRRSDDFDAALVFMFHRLYMYNASLAEELHDKLISRSFDMPASADLKAIYRLLYNALGFRMTGRLLRWAGWRPV